jgi:hypothetical protein
MTLELLTLVLHHPTSWQSTRDQAAALVAELAAELPPEAVVAAQERGQARDLRATVAELLAAKGDSVAGQDWGGMATVEDSTRIEETS